MDHVSIVSTDGHSVMPAELWPEYLEAAFHEHLPALHADNDVNRRTMYPTNDMLMVPALDVYDTEGAYQDGRWSGAWDADVRLAEMDREGIASELVFHGFFRVSDLGFCVVNATFPPDVVDAGARAHNRWAHDTFGEHSLRLPLVGAMLSCTDLDAVMSELDWVADHGFVGTYAPGFLGVPDLPPLDHECWDPVWARYVERNLAVVVHAGYGMEQGYAFRELEAAVQRTDAKGGGVPEMIQDLMEGLFTSGFFGDITYRRALWQMLLGGVFDRHPELRVLVTEVRADWVPDVLAHLDAQYDAHRADLPSRRRPSEWWESNCLVGASFMHKAEAEMRDEIGIDRLVFGRDYPHAEGTWPNTRDFLRDLFGGVPEADVRKILGENAIRFFGFDADALAAIAEKIGPTMADITGGGPVAPELIEHLDVRTGYLKPAERGSRLGELAEPLQADLARYTAAAGR